MYESILRLPEVMAKTGLSRSSIYAAISHNTFPKPIKLGARASGWPESEIQEWVLNKISESRITEA